MTLWGKETAELKTNTHASRLGCVTEFNGYNQTFKKCIYNVFLEPLQLLGVKLWQCSKSMSRNLYRNYGKVLRIFLEMSTNGKQ